MLHHLTRFTAIALTTVFISSSADASTVRIVGGETNIAFDPGAVAALSSFHIDVAVAQGSFDPATLTATFGISGGTVSGDDLEIEHVPSVLLLSNAVGATATLANFLINLDAATLTGTVSALVNGGSDFVEVLNIAPPEAGDAGVRLEVNDFLGGAIAGIFSTDTKTVPNLSGALLATAATSPELAPIPVPAGLPLLAAGLGGFAFLARRKRKSA